MKQIFIAVAFSVILFSCNQKELTKLKEENQELLAQTEEKDSTLVVFMESFSEIEQNLAEIRERELNIALANRENKTNNSQVQQQIQEDIQAINQLIADNKQTIQDLNAQLEQSKGKNVQLNKMLAKLKDQLTVQIEEKDQQIALLKDDLQRMNFTITELSADLDTMKYNNEALAQDNQLKQSTIQEKVNELNTAYVALGSKKELEQEKIIIKEGGFLGIGKTEKLAANLDTNHFQKVDIREITSIPVAAKKIELVTSHPADSYQIKGDDRIEAIEITDPAKFWINSKYLVVRVDE